MPKIAANLTLMFQEIPASERIAAAAAGGFDGVEILTPYDQPPKQIVADLAVNAMPLALINSPAGDWDQGERGMAAIPERQMEFRTGFSRALEFADIVQPDWFHILSGLADGPKSAACYRENLAWACAQEPNRDFLIEPISPAGCAGYFLNDFDQAVGIINDLALPNLFLQYDVYHAAMRGLDPIAAFDQYLPLIRHVQISSVPDRHEPDHGEVDYPAFLAHLDASGYTGWVSAEYFPRNSTVSGLNWLAQYGNTPPED